MLQSDFVISRSDKSDIRLAEYAKSPHDAKSRGEESNHATKKLKRIMDARIEEIVAKVS